MAIALSKRDITGMFEAESSTQVRSRLDRQRRKLRGARVDRDPRVRAFRQRGHLFLREAHRQPGVVRAGRSARARDVLEADRLGGRGGGAADRRAAAERLRPAGRAIRSSRCGRNGQRLATEQASLELEEAQLLSPARMEELAREQQFIDPPSQKVVYLDNAQARFAGDEPRSKRGRTGRRCHAGNSIHPTAALAAVDPAWLGRA